MNLEILAEIALREKDMSEAPTQDVVKRKNIKSPEWKVGKCLGCVKDDKKISKENLKNKKEHADCCVSGDDSEVKKSIVWKNVNTIEDPQEKKYLKKVNRKWEIEHKN